MGMFKIGQEDFHMGLAVLGAFLFLLVMRRVKRRSKKEDVMDDEHWI